MTAEQIANLPEEFKTDTVQVPNLHKVLALEIIALKERVKALETHPETCVCHGTGHLSKEIEDGIWIYHCEKR